jgi:hypothetical protein
LSTWAYTLKCLPSPIPIISQCKLFIDVICNRWNHLFSYITSIFTWSFAQNTTSTYHLLLNNYREDYNLIRSVNIVCCFKIMLSILFILTHCFYSLSMALGTQFFGSLTGGYQSRHTFFLYCPQRLQTMVSTLPIKSYTPTTVKTLQRSPRFRSLFD